MLLAILSVSALAAAFGLLLGYAALRFRVEGDPLVEKIDALLPQTQCGQCGFPGCHPYAEAIARGEADINLCAPGGEANIAALADLLGREPKSPDSARGAAKPRAVPPSTNNHRLHAVHPSLPGGCDLRRIQADAHHHRCRVHRLRTVRRALPGGLHRHGTDQRTSRPEMALSQSSWDADDAHALRVSRRTAPPAHKPIDRPPVARTAAATAVPAAATTHRRAGRTGVKVGDTVRKGQRAGRGLRERAGACASWVPSPRSPSYRSRTLRLLAPTIETDGRETWPSANPSTTTRLH